MSDDLAGLIAVHGHVVLSKTALAVREDTPADSRGGGDYFCKGRVILED